MGDLINGVWRSLRDGDFEEEDVWDVLRHTKISTSRPNYGKFTESSVPISRNLPTAARMIPIRATSFSSNNSSDNSSYEAKVVQQSAPVNIPDWSHITRKKSTNASMNASPWLDHDGGGYVVNGEGVDYDSGGGDDDDVDDDDDEGEGDDLYNHKLPPHEFIARRLARTQISSFSVFEGVGRTLKGRDLSKVIFFTCMQERMENLFGIGLGSLNDQSDSGCAFKCLKFQSWPKTEVYKSNRTERDMPPTSPFYSFPSLPIP